MSKLLKLKKFFTIDEAAKYLSSVLEEDVSETDIYGFALERHLTISVKFNSLIEISPGCELSESDLPYNANNSNSFVNRLGHSIYFEDGVVISEGIWDLSMLGGEFIEIDSLHKSATDGRTWECPRVDAVILKKNSVFCKLKCLESNLDEAPHVISDGEVRDLTEERIDCLTLGYYSHRLVIRKEELNRFIHSLDDEQTVIPVITEEDKPLASRERNTLLTLIGVLCNDLGINPSVRGVTASVQAMTELAGTPISDDTIRKILKEVPTALEQRHK